VRLRSAANVWAIFSKSNISPQPPPQFRYEKVEIMKVQRLHECPVATPVAFGLKHAGDELGGRAVSTSQRQPDIPSAELKYAPATGRCYPGNALGTVRVAACPGPLTGNLQIIRRSTRRTSTGGCSVARPAPRSGRIFSNDAELESARAVVVARWCDSQRQQHCDDEAGWMRYAHSRVRGARMTPPTRKVHLLPC
jgi:hypothetical protein